MADAQHLAEPSTNLRIVVHQRCGDRRRTQEPEAVRDGEIRQRRRSAQQELALLARQLLLQARHEHRPVALGLLQRHPAHRAVGEQLRAVLAEHLNELLGHLGETQRHGFGLEDQAHGIQKQYRVGPLSKRRRSELLTFGEQRRSGLLRFQPTSDQRRVAVDIGADLQHRRTPVAPGQRGEIRLGHDRRDHHRTPGQLLESEHQARLLGEGRGGIVVQDQLVHDRLRQRKCRDAP